MNQRTPSVEEQLRRYADGIDPAMTTAQGTRSSGRRRKPSLKTTWLAAAATVIALLGIAALTQRDSVQQVDTGAFAEQPEDSEADDDATPIPPLLPAGVPPTGDMRTREDSLVVMMAELTLVGECMAAQGFDFTTPTDREWVELFGGWSPSGVLGIGSEGAARLIGYRSDGWGGAGSPSQSAAWMLMSQEEQDAHYTALTGLSAGPAPLPPPPSASGEFVEPTPIPRGPSCWASTESALGDYTNKKVAFDDVLRFGSDGTQGERFRSDPALETAIVNWQVCVRDSTGIQADTPNTLARKYAFTEAPLTDQERDVAVADIRCQDAVGLEQAFYLARTKQLRAELGEDLAVFDDYVRFRIDTVALAQQVLDERGIVPPSLD